MHKNKNKVYTRPNNRKSNTLRHFEGEAVRERLKKKEVMLNLFLVSAKVKNVYFVRYSRIFNMADKILQKMQSAQCSACLLYTSPSPRDWLESRMPSSA